MSKFVHYVPTIDRLLWLDDNIRELEDFLSLELITQAFIDYLEDFDACINAGVNIYSTIINLKIYCNENINIHSIINKTLDMHSVINDLELYNANLMYYYNKL